MCAELYNPPSIGVRTEPRNPFMLRSPRLLVLLLALAAAGAARADGTDTEREWQEKYGRRGRPPEKEQEVASEAERHFELTPMAGVFVANPERSVRLLPDTTLHEGRIQLDPTPVIGLRMTGVNGRWQFGGE